MRQHMACIALLLFSLSCGHQEKRKDAMLNPPESFAESDRPSEYRHDPFTFTGPWGYDKNENKSRKYPLLVSGCWGEGAGQYSAYAQKYPAFVLNYQKNTAADGETLGQWIKDAIGSGYRIDIDRIYLTGFSKGGSGSFPLAQGMNNAGLYFAAIIRIAGQSNYDLGEGIAEKTALWYHIGLDDTPQRVEVARKALEHNRNYACNMDVIETSVSDSITGHERNTVTMKRRGRPMFIYSEYAGMGHTPEPCYKDGSLFPWLFSHSLEGNYYSGN